MKNDFMKRGEEAYALSAKVDEILKENGFWRSGTSSVFVHKSPSVRIVKRPGTRDGMVLNFGVVERQIRDGDNWVTKNAMRFDDFVNADEPMKALEEADSSPPEPPKPKPPKPTPLW